jgi:hypothetical protein
VVFTACIAVGGVLQAADGLPQPSRAIEFSAPKSNTAVTNLNQLSEEILGTRDLEADSAAPSSLTLSGSSLGGLTPLPPPSGGVIIQNRWSQHKDWSAMTPEEIMNGVALKEMLKLPNSGNDGGEARSASTVEGMYEQALFGRAGTARQPQKHDLQGWETAEKRSGTSKSDNPNLLLPDSDRQEQSLKNLLGSDLYSRYHPSGASRDRLADVFGPNNDNTWSEVSPESILAKETQAATIRQFQNMLDETYVVQPSVPGRISPAADPGLSSNPGSSPALDSRNPFAPTPGVAVDPALLPPTAPHAPVPSSLSPAPFSFTPPLNSLLMRKPDSTMPRRAF